EQFHLLSHSQHVIYGWLRYAVWPPQGYPRAATAADAVARCATDEQRQADRHAWATLTARNLAAAGVTTRPSTHPSARTACTPTWSPRSPSPTRRAASNGPSRWLTPRLSTAGRGSCTPSSASVAPPRGTCHDRLPLLGPHRQG